MVTFGCDEWVSIWEQNTQGLGTKFYLLSSVKKLSVIWLTFAVFAVMDFDSREVI